MSVFPHNQLRIMLTARDGGQHKIDRIGVELCSRRRSGIGPASDEDDDDDDALIPDSEIRNFA